MSLGLGYSSCFAFYLLVAMNENGMNMGVQYNPVSQGIAGGWGRGLSRLVFNIIYSFDHSRFP